MTSGVRAPQREGAVQGHVVLGGRIYVLLSFEGEVGETDLVVSDLVPRNVFAGVVGRDDREGAFLVGAERASRRVHAGAVRGDGGAAERPAGRVVSRRLVAGALVVPASRGVAVPRPPF